MDRDVVEEGEGGGQREGEVEEEVVGEVVEEGSGGGVGRGHLLL